MGSLRNDWKAYSGLLLVLSLCRPSVGQGLSPEIDRSPVDLVVSIDESWLAVANQSANSVSLVRITDGAVLDEVQVGQRPTAVTLHPDQQSLLVTTANDGRMTRLRVQDQKLVVQSTFELGYQPHGIAVSADGQIAYVALAAAAQVAVIDLKSGEVTQRIDVGRWPRYMTLSADGERLAVGTSGDMGISVVDLQSRQLLFQEKYYALNIGHLINSPDGKHILHPWTLYGNNPINARMIRLGWVLASRIARVRWDGPAMREALALDPPGMAVADLFGIGSTADHRRIVISASGTHELLVYAQEGLPWREYGIGDHIDRELQQNGERFFRIPLGGRPMGLRTSRNPNLVYVANYLQNSIQEVDLERRQVARTFSLGGPAEPSLVRRGEAIFHDGQRSLDQWYSCHSCHYEGGSNAVRMDTMNDGSASTYKTVLPLYHLRDTGPWTWHGWQKSLTSAVRHSLTTTMLGKEPADEDVDALEAYLGQLELPPNPNRRDTEAVERGVRLFVGEKAGCVQCHQGPHFTDHEIHDLGLGTEQDRYTGFNTPSLRGVYQKVRLLHDGRAKSLEAVLRGDHNPARVAGKGELTESELRDLIEYLKTL